MADGMQDRIAEIIVRLERVERLLSQLIGEQLRPINDGMSDESSKLINMARIDPEAAIAEAKRLSRLHTLKQREAKKRSKAK